MSPFWNGKANAGSSLVIVAVVVAVLLRFGVPLSVTVKLTVNVPVVGRVWFAVEPLPLPVSPKAHAYVRASASRSEDAVPSNATGRPAVPVYEPPGFATGARLTLLTVMLRDFWSNSEA